MKVIVNIYASKNETGTKNFYCELLTNKKITYWTCSVITALYIVPTLKYNTIEKIKTCIFFINYFTKNL